MARGALVIEEGLAALIVSLGFDRRSPAKTAAARAAADELLEAYIRYGLMPYRLGLDQADHLPQMDGPWPEIIRGIQRTLDPHGSMAASRYDSLWERKALINLTIPKAHELCAA